MAVSSTERSWNRTLTRGPVKRRDGGVERISAAANGEKIERRFVEEEEAETTFFGNRSFGENGEKRLGGCAEEMKTPERNEETVCGGGERESRV